MDPNRQPVLFLYLQASPEDIDVNVHPTKIEVRWTDSAVVHGLTLSALRETLLAHDNTPPLQVDGQPPSSATPGDSSPQQRIRQAIADFFKDTGPMQQQHLGYPRRSSSPGSGTPSGSGRHPTVPSFRLRRRPARQDTTASCE